MPENSSTHPTYVDRLDLHEGPVAMNPEPLNGKLSGKLRRKQSPVYDACAPEPNDTPVGYATTIDEAVSVMREDARSRGYPDPQVNDVQFYPDIGFIIDWDSANE